MRGQPETRTAAYSIDHEKLWKWVCDRLVPPPKAYAGKKRRS